MIEVALGICWSVSYFLICVYSLKYREEKKVFMPLIAGAMNFGWEIHALIVSKGLWTHIVWLLLDVIIIAYNLYALKTSQKVLYTTFTILLIISLYFIFRIPQIDGMLISSFAIDIIMAIEYLVFIKALSNKGRTLIGVFRLLGDLFAWISNGKLSTFVSVVGVLVLIINLLYISYSLELDSISK